MADLSPEQLAQLPLFPLPRLVFFPHTLLPLHVFEPRYRVMVRWCIDNDWPMAVVLIALGHEREQLGEPPIADVAGVGRIVQHRRLPDGRYTFVLEGLARVKLEELADRDTPYRSSRARVIADRWPQDTAHLDGQVGTIRSCLTALRIQWPAAPEGLFDWILKSKDAAVLSDRIGSALFSDQEAQQALLSCAEVDQRVGSALERVVELLSSGLDEDAIRH